MSNEAWFALFGVILELIGLIAAGIWALAKLRLQLQEELRRETEIIRERATVVSDTQQQRFGETITAIRMKVTEVELFSRDTFMRRDAFMVTMDQVRGDIRDQFAQIVARLTRMEEKIDSH